MALGLQTGCERTVTLAPVDPDAGYLADVSRTSLLSNSHDARSYPPRRLLSLQFANWLGYT